MRLKLGALIFDTWLNIRAAREFPMEAGDEVWFHMRPWSFCLLPPEDEREKGPGSERVSTGPGVGKEP
jgi:hypothetical protein